MDFLVLPERTEPLAIERVPAGFSNVRFAPQSDRLLRCREMTLGANRDILHRGKTPSLFAIGQPQSRSQIGRLECDILPHIAPT